MASEIERGIVDWSGTVDDEGHREYSLTWQIIAAITDGPAVVFNTPGIYLPGATWNYAGDFDFWAFCRPRMTATPRVKKDNNRYWDLTQTFSTKPFGNKCQDQQIEDPLLEPQRVSGTFNKYTEEATHDRFGSPIISSSWEQIRGASVEFDKNRPSVSIEQNVALLGLDTFPQMVDTLNDAPLWGLPVRAVKLSNVTWSKEYYGQCNAYYKRKLDFDIRVKRDLTTGNIVGDWDRDVLDEGSKALNGRWGLGGDEGYSWVLENIGGSAPNPNNPAHFKRVVDRDGNPMKVILNGAGIPLNVEAGSGSAASDPGSIHVEKYDESNMLLLGIPTSF